MTVFLVEAGSVELGGELSEPVRAAMEDVIAIVERDFLARLRPADDGPGVPSVEFTDDGYLRLGARLAAHRFPADAAVAALRDGELWLVPLSRPQSGGLLLKQRNLAGDRAVLVRETLEDRVPVGVHEAIWDAEQGPCGSRSARHDDRRDRPAGLGAAGRTGGRRGLRDRRRPRATARSGPRRG
ncbi:hypothetical protein ACFQV8_00465 [Pseudonocardia benzenivorans]